MAVKENQSKSTESGKKTCSGKCANCQAKKAARLAKLENEKPDRSHD